MRQSCDLVKRIQQNRCFAGGSPSSGSKDSDFRKVFLISVCAPLFLESGVCGQEKALQQGTSEVSTNLNSATPSGGEQNTNTPAGLFGGTGAGASQLPTSLRPFQLVLPKEHLFGDWFGLRPKAEQLGISPTVTFVTDIAGNVSGGKDQGVTHADNLGINFLFDLDKLTGLQGGSFLASMAQR